MSKTIKHIKTYVKSGTLVKEYNNAKSILTREISNFSWSRRDYKSDRLKRIRKASTHKMRNFLKKNLKDIID